MGRGSGDLALAGEIRGINYTYPFLGLNVSKRNKRFVGCMPS